jgi:hypothetical protein
MTRDLTRNGFHEQTNFWLRWNYTGYGQDTTQPVPVTLTRLLSPCTASEEGRLALASPLLQRQRQSRHDISTPPGCTQAETLQFIFFEARLRFLRHHRLRVSQSPAGSLEQALLAVGLDRDAVLAHAAAGRALLGPVTELVVDPALPPPPPPPPPPKPSALGGQRRSQRGG